MRMIELVKKKKKMSMSTIIVKCLKSALRDIKELKKIFFD